jgi:hypothetical protein
MERVGDIHIIERGDKHLTVTRKMDIRWIVTADVDFKHVEHLTAKKSVNDSKEMGVTHSRDGQELCWATGREILTIFESLC